MRTRSSNLFLTVILLFVMLHPKSRFITLIGPGNQAGSLASNGITLDGSPNHFPSHGLARIAEYVSRLCAPSDRFKSIRIFTADGNRGFGAIAQAEFIEISLSIDLCREPEREIKIRSFFDSLQLQPSQDYFAENGNVANACRYFSYRVPSDAGHVAGAFQGIMQEIFGISATDALNITYTEP